MWTDKAQQIAETLSPQAAAIRAQNGGTPAQAVAATNVPAPTSQTLLEEYAKRTGRVGYG